MSEDLILKFGAEDAASAIIQKLGGNMDGLGGKVGEVIAKFVEFAAVTAAAVIGTLVAATAQTIEAGHAAFEMSEKFGLAGDQASAWLAAASAVGVSNEAMSNGFKFAAKNMEAINLALSNGHKPAAALVDAYQALGVNIYDQSGKLRDLNSVMLDAAAAFANMPDGAEKAGLAVKLFGRSGSDLIPILNEGRDGILALMQTAQESGVVLTDSQVKTAQAAYLAQKQFDQALKGVSLTLGAALLPYAVQLLNWLVSVMPRVLAFGSAVEKALLPYLLAFGAWMQGTGLPALERLIATIQRLLPPIEQWAQQMWSQVSPSLQDISKRSGDFVPILEAVAIVAGVLIVVLANVVVGVVELADWILRLYDDRLVPLRNAFVDLSNNVLVGIATGIKGAINWFEKLGAVVGAVGKLVSDFGSGDFGALAGDVTSLQTLIGFDKGGMVPGPIGAPMVAVVHGGERVQTPAQQSGDLSTGRLEELLSQAVAILAAIHSDTGAPIYGQTAVQQTGG